MNDSILKTIGVAFSVCLVCSLIVSSAAVSLRDLQNENKLNDRRIKVLQVADIYNPNESISEQFNQLESKFIDFKTGMLMDEYNNFSLEDYDQVVATKNPNLSSFLITVILESSKDETISNDLSSDLSSIIICLQFL